MLGAKPTLEALLDVVVKYAVNNGPVEAVLDIVTAMICAPVAGDARERLSLRDALQSASSDAYALSKTDNARAELIVRLQRRVDVQWGRGGGGEMDGTIAVEGDGGVMLLDMGDNTGGGGVGVEGMEGVMDVGLDMSMSDMMGTEGEDFQLSM
jgi:hypothetical protein